VGTPYLATIMPVAFNFPPKGWAFCNGQTLPINQNQALFSLLGTTYGGNGTTTFALPNLQSRLPLNFGQGSGLSPYTLGQQGGTTSQTLTQSQMPQHTHLVEANSGLGTSAAAGSNFPAAVAPGTRPAYYAASTDTTMNPAMLSAAGGGQAFSLLQPYLAINFCIALQGIFPSRN
jgi:microcystin-dependent protein